MPDDDKIRIRAHQIWEAEGRPHGRDREHWEQARREIANEAPAISKTSRRGRSPEPGSPESIVSAYRDSRDSPGATGETIQPPKTRGKRKPTG